MRSVVLTAVLLSTMAASAAYAADAAKPKAKAQHAKPATMSDEKRRDLERRIEALEQKYEMQYHETDAPTGTGAPAAPAAKPATH